MAKAEILRPFILSWEGGFAKIKGDRGGATNKGVTLSTFRQVFGYDRTEAELKRLSDTQWMTIYKKLFWNRWKADEIKSQSIANLLVDWVWTSGKYGIIKPQKVLGVEADGIVGTKTLAAINQYPDEKELFCKLWVARENYIDSIAIGAQAKFRRGWLNRLGGLKYGKIVCAGGKVIDY